MMSAPGQFRCNERILGGAMVSLGVVAACPKGRASQRDRMTPVGERGG
jgi:hypothetical protein